MTSPIRNQNRNTFRQPFHSSCMVTKLTKDAQGSGWNTSIIHRLDFERFEGSDLLFPGLEVPEGNNDTNSATNGVGPVAHSRGQIARNKHYECNTHSNQDSSFKLVGSFNKYIDSQPETLHQVN